MAHFKKSLLFAKIVPETPVVDVIKLFWRKSRFPQN